jgi:hypothetical protein
MRRWSSVAFGFDEDVKSTNPPSFQYPFQSLIFFLSIVFGKLGVCCSGEKCAVNDTERASESDLTV